MSKKFELLYENISEIINLKLNKGEIRLPTERELSDMYNVSRQTVRRTLLELVKNGYIEKVQGSGLYLTGKRPGSFNTKIALLIPETQEYTYPSFISAITKLFEDKGFELMVYNTHDHSNEERIILNSLDTASLAAVIVFPISARINSPNIDLFEKFKGEHIPVLFCQGSYQNLQTVSCIREDYPSGGYMLAEYLLHQGHTDIAALVRSDCFSDLEKLYGIERALFDNNNALDGKNLFFYDSRRLNTLRQNNDTTFLHKYISQGLTKCSAVICSTDEIAYHLIKELTLSGISIPEDIRVLSFDDSYLCTLSEISISSLAIKNTTFALATVNACLNLIKNQQQEISLLHYELKERRS